MRSMQYIWKNSLNGRFPYRLGILFITLSLLASACAPAAQNGADELNGTPSIQEPAATETPADTATPPSRELPTIRAPELIPVPTGAAITPGDPLSPGNLYPPVTGEAPASLLEDIRTDLAQRSGADREDMLVIRDQAVIWSDGSLGCPQPGVFYTQALVPGYWVVLQVGEVEYDYRASDRGYFVLCEGGGLPFSQPQDQ
jgi:hypothetical protein